MKKDRIAILSTNTTVKLIDDVIAEIKIPKDIDFELDDVISTTQTIEEVGMGRKLYYLTIVGDRTVPSQEARLYAMSKLGSRFKKAEAIVARSLSQKMVFNFMINSEEPYVQTKLFNTVDEAKKWLKSLIQ